MAPISNQTLAYLNRIDDYLNRIDGKLNRIGEQINDLSNRVTRLEAQQGSHVSATEARFQALQGSIAHLESELEAAKASIGLAQAELAKSQGGFGAIKWVLAVLLALAGAAGGLTGSQITAAIQQADQATQAQANP